MQSFNTKQVNEINTVKKTTIIHYLIIFSENLNCTLNTSQY